MFAALRRHVSRTTRVEVCDSCGQVCTASCRAEARRDQIRTDALRAFPFPR
jgi:epoxyqueuosine reductase QueG